MAGDGSAVAVPIVVFELARSGLDDDGGPLAQLVSEGLEQAEQAIAEIRELARGIHPAILSERGPRQGAGVAGAALTGPGHA